MKYVSINEKKNANFKMQRTFDKLFLGEALVQEIAGRSSQFIIEDSVIEIGLPVVSECSICGPHVENN